MDEREIRAFSLAPLPWVVPLLLAVSVNATVWGTGDAGYGGVFAAIVVLVLLSYFATLVIGAPIHFVLKIFEKTGLIHYVSLAVLPFVLFAGAIAVWIPLAPAPGPHINPHGLYMNGGFAIKWTLVLAAIALLSATTFWYAGVRKPKL